MTKTQLNTFSTLDLSNYLKSEGWACKGQYPEKAFVFSKENHSVLVPVHKNFPDYYLRISQTVRDLSELENRESYKVIRDLQATGADLFRLKIDSPEVEQGLITLDKGALLFDSAKTIIQSAARSADSPKTYYRSRPSQQADEYLKTVKLGQTEKGSYIVTVMLPVIPDLQKTLPTLENEIEVPYGRKVTLQLTNALNLLEQSIQSQIASPGIQSFLDAAPSGVNANLCDALVAIGEAIPGASVDTQMTWARTRGKPTIKTTARFQDDDFSYLSSASRALREQAWGEEFILVGNITKLSSEQPLDGGEVILKATVSDKRRSVKLQLNPKQYQQAVQVHKDYSDVEVTGVVEQQGQSLVIEQVREMVPLLETEIENHVSNRPHIR